MQHNKQPKEYTNKNPGPYAGKFSGTWSITEGFIEACNASLKQRVDDTVKRMEEEGRGSRIKSAQNADS